MSTAGSSGRRSQAKPPHQRRKTPSDCKATRDNISDATSQLRFKTRKAAGPSPRGAAQPGHQSVRTRADHYHAHSRESGASGGGKNDHPRQARHAAIAPPGRLLHHATRGHAETLQRDRAQILRPRRRLHPDHSRRQPRRRQRQGGHPRARWLRIQSQGKEGKNQEGRTRRSQELAAAFCIQQPVPSLSLGRAFFFLQIFVIQLSAKVRQAAGALPAASSASPTDRRQRNHSHSTAKAANAPAESSRESYGDAVRLATNAWWISSSAE